MITIRACGDDGDSGVQMASTNTVRWNISVSAETDQSLRRFLARPEGGCESDLSRFVEEAVKSHILNLTTGQAKLANADVDQSDLTAVIEDALQWTRDNTER